MRLDPSFAIAYFSKGIALYKLKRYEEALAACEQAERLDSNDALVYRCKAKALFRLGQWGNAVQTYQRAKELGRRAKQ